MLRIHQIRLGLEEKESSLLNKAAKMLKIKPKDIQNLEIVKMAFDCRKKPILYRVYTVDVKVEKEEKIGARFKPNQVSIRKEAPYHIPKSKSIAKRPVIVGMGPAGIFSALFFCESGISPIILERGAEVEKRYHQVQSFWQGGPFLQESNVQFGEGGAGTFSDGKLQTGIQDKRIRYMLKRLVDFGASPEILIQSKPHVGSDVLRRVLINIRKYLLDRGAEIHFESQVSDILLTPKGIAGVYVKERFYEADRVLLALGNGARDTIEMLQKRGLQMTEKPFAIGVRIEHPQSLIDDFSYGPVRHKYDLPPSDYKLVYHGQGGETCYSFCMCPGGYVINSSSEENQVSVNGMSNQKRDGNYANSALLVPVEGREAGDGIRLQQEIEKKAFIAGGGNYFAPIQRVADFKNRQATKHYGKIAPSYLPGVKGANLWTVLPFHICETLEGALNYFGNIIPGFDDEEAILTAPETKSSSPVKMWRDENFESNIPGIYPIGEGAGYAGGITSSAIDGLKAAERICSLI